MQLLHSALKLLVWSFQVPIAWHADAGLNGTLPSPLAAAKNIQRQQAAWFLLNVCGQGSLWPDLAILIGAGSAVPKIRKLAK